MSHPRQPSPFKGVPCRYRAQARAGRLELDLYGIIGSDWFGEGITAKQVADDLKGLGKVKTIDVRINSEGGNVFDGKAIYSLLVENKASGHSVAQELRRVYGYDEFAVQLIDPKGVDKLARLYSIQHLFAEGLIYAPDRSWADAVITQAAQFPRAKHDDLVDTV